MMPIIHIKLALRADLRGHKKFDCLTLLHSERPKLLRVLAILSPVGLREVTLNTDSVALYLGSRDP